MKRFPVIAYNHYLTAFLTLMLFLTGCLSTSSTTPPVASSTPATSTAFPATDTPAPEPASPWLEIYFTNPFAPEATTYKGGPDEALAAAIDQALLSVDVAAYSLNLWSIRDALLRAVGRGVLVRMVMESENMDEEEVQQLLEAGIPIVGDQRQGLMHNKFVVIDRAEVWTGSMNYTVGGTYRDNNNLIRIRSVQVAEDYTTEFNEMFEYNLFGEDTHPATPYPRLTVDGVSLEVYFSPDDRVAERLLELVQGARSSIYFMAYTFTSNDLGEAIIERAGEGVEVAGVMDAGQALSAAGTEYDRFMQAGLDVLLDGNPKGLLHHKVIILDQSVVITGSYNFTRSAEERNDENVVIIFDQDTAAQYLEEFRRRYHEAQISAAL